jgi:hypothetical protein
MRQGQQKRMRGRNRGGGGKGPNTLNRTFESNGPDVKVRGTAAHIAEKYVQLARDAQSSGDPILAEAYLQHAEHYFRVIAAAQPQFNGQQPGFAGPQEEEDEGEDLDFEGPIPSMPPQPYSGTPHGDDQPRFRDQQRDRNFGERNFGGDRPHYGDRQDRQDGDRQHQDRYSRDRYQNDRGPRPDRQDRPFEGQSNGYRGEEGDGDRGYSRRDRHNRRDGRFNDRPYQDRQQGERQAYGERGPDRNQPYQERPYQPQPVVPIDQPQPEVPDDASLAALPSFITGPAPVAPASPAASEGEGEARFPLRSRRRRAPKRSQGEEGEAPAADPGVEPVGE